jgi:hypothetical protein
VCGRSKILRFPEGTGSLRYGAAKPLLVYRGRPRSPEVEGRGRKTASLHTSRGPQTTARARPCSSSKPEGASLRDCRPEGPRSLMTPDPKDRRHPHHHAPTSENPVCRTTRPPHAATRTSLGKRLIGESCQHPHSLQPCATRRSCMDVMNVPVGM